MMTETKIRNGSIDFFKLVAALFVVLLHINFQPFPEALQAQIRLIGRWVVPFFFMASGYFSFKGLSEDQDKIITKRVDKLLGVLIVANIAYLFIRLLEYNSMPLRDLLSFETFLCGTFYHLWFLGSMIIGYLLIWFLYKRKLEKLLMPLSILILLLVIISDSYMKVIGINLNGDFFRYFLSVPFLFFGIQVSKNDNLHTHTKIPKPNLIVSIILILLGISLQITEAKILFDMTDYSPLKHQFLIGTVPLSFGIFFFAQNINISDKNILAQYGQKYLLGVYLYHLFISYTVFRCINYFVNHYFTAIQPFIQYTRPILVFLITLFFLVIVDKYFNKFFQFIHGSFSGELLLLRKKDKTK